MILSFVASTNDRSGRSSSLGASTSTRCSAGTPPPAPSSSHSRMWSASRTAPCSAASSDQYLSIPTTSAQFSTLLPAVMRRLHRTRGAPSDLQRSLSLESSVLGAHRVVVGALRRRHLRADGLGEPSMRAVELAVLPDGEQLLREEAVPVAVHRELVVLAARDQNHAGADLVALGGRMALLDAVVQLLVVLVGALGDVARQVLRAYLFRVDDVCVDDARDRG